MKITRVLKIISIGIISVVFGVGLLYFIPYIFLGILCVLGGMLSCFLFAGLIMLMISRNLEDDDKTNQPPNTTPPK